MQLLRSFTRTEIIGGYSAHLRLPRQQWPVIAAGSVFEFSLPQTPDAKCLLKLERAGLGMRKGEGYGRIAVNRHGNIGLSGRAEKQLDDWKSHIIPREMPQEVKDLLESVMRTRCVAEMRERAMDVAKVT